MPGSITVLLPILESLASYEETVVREQVWNSLIQVAEMLTD